MQRERCKWIGNSGLRYTYTVLALPCALRAGQHGNYIFARRDHSGRWVPIYIGHGELSLACSSRNEQWSCIAGHGATHVHCHLSEDGEACANEQDDLLSRYRNALAPYGCNILSPHTTPAAGAGEPSQPTDLEISPSLSSSPSTPSSPPADPGPSDPGISPALVQGAPHPPRARPEYPT